MSSHSSLVADTNTRAGRGVILKGYNIASFITSQLEKVCCFLSSRNSNQTLLVKKRSITTTSTGLQYCKLLWDLDLPRENTGSEEDDRHRHSLCPLLLPTPLACSSRRSSHISSRIRVRLGPGHQVWAADAWERAKLLQGLLVLLHAAA